MIDLTEFNKLEKYLRDNNVIYTRTTNVYPKMFSDGADYEKNQIIVYDDALRRSWDAVCSIWSFGGDNGLLEIMGDIVVPEDFDDVVGYLTADDVIARFEAIKKS